MLELSTLFEVILFQEIHYFFWIFILGLLATRIVPYLFNSNYRQWEEGFQLSFHILSLLFAFTQVKSVGIFTSDKVAVSSIEDVHPDLLKYVFMSYMYYASLLVLVYIPPRKKDLKEITFHHVATLILMTVAWWWGYFDISAYVLLINDITDIFLGLSTIGNITRSWIKYPAFVCFYLCHVILRIVCFFFEINKFSFSSHGQGYYDVPFWLCMPLIAINIYWMKKLTAIIQKFIRTPEDRDKLDYRD